MTPALAGLISHALMPARRALQALPRVLSGAGTWIGSGAIRPSRRESATLTNARPPTQRPPTSGPALRADAPPAIIALVYELLDAHEDTARLAGELAEDPDWLSHLEYLRGLQRAGREVLAHACVGSRA
jgi:hypothetical protein